MAVVEAGAGRDEANTTGIRVDKMKKKSDVESGACGQGKLENNDLCRSSEPREELVKSSSSYILGGVSTCASPTIKTKTKRK